MATSLPDVYRGLAALLRAGVVVHHAVGSLRANGTLKDPLGAELEQRLGAGESFSAALARQPHVPREDVAVIEAGEATGRLDETLERLAALHEQRSAGWRRLKWESAYNVAIYHVAAIVMPFGLLHLSRSFSAAAWTFWTVLVLSPFYAAVAAVTILRRTPAGQERLRHFVERLPGFGAAARHQRFSRFAHALEAAYESGMPLDRAVALGAEAVASPAGDRAAGAVAKGSRLTAALAGTRLVSDRALRQLDAAETAGELGTALRGIGAEEAVEAEIATKRAMALLTRGIYVLLVLAGFAYAVRMLGPVISLYR